MLSDVHDDIQVTGASAATAVVAFSRQSETLPAGDAGGNLYCYLAFTSDFPVALARLTWLGDYPTDAPATRACPRYRKRTLLETDLTATLTLGALFRSASRGRP